MDQNYIPPMRMSQPTSSSSTSAYSQPSRSPGLYQSRTVPGTSSIGRRHSEFPNDAHADSSYHQSYRRISSPYESMHSNEYSMATGQTIPSISGLTHSPLPSPHLGSTSGSAGMSQYHPGVSRYALSNPLSLRSISNSFQIARPLRTRNIRAILQLQPQRRVNVRLQPEHELPRPLRRQQHARLPAQAPRQRDNELLDPRAQPAAQAAVLGARLQRPPVLDLQQLAAPSAREVRHRVQVVLSQVRGGVHADHGEEWAFGARQVHEATTAFGGGVKPSRVVHCARLGGSGC